MSKYQPVKLPLADGLPFIETVEKALAAEMPDTRYIDEVIPKLEKLAEQYQTRIFQLAQLQFRVRTILDQHEPPADKRGN